MEIPMKWVGLTALLSLGAIVPVMGQQEGRVDGFVGFGENFPPAKSITISQDVKVCGTRQLDEEYVINKDNHGLANAVIFWELPAGSKPPGASEPVILAQIGCRYEPHVQVAASGSDILRVLNEDGILHNVHAFDENGGTFFNFAQPGFKKQIEKKLPDSRIINIKCDVHAWMNAYIIALPNAIFAITDKDGRFSLEGIAPGPQKIRIWHEGLGSTSREVVVVAGQVATLDFVIGK